MLVLALIAATPLAAWPAEQLRTLEGPSFNCEIHPWLEGNHAVIDSQASYAAAEQFGINVLNMSGLRLQWPKSERSIYIFSGQYGDMVGSGGRPLETSICIGDGDSDMRLLGGGDWPVPGFLSKLSVWPDQRSAQANLVVLASFSEGYEDSRVIGFRISPAGEVSPVDTGNAHTQWGEFQVADLDDNGTYELLCYRNLDGMVGGLSYRSVRDYDVSASAYVPAPERHRRFFEREVDWLDWVVSTRDQVMADPAAYLTEEGSGAYYQATYNGVSYGFDTIVFVDNPSYDRDVARQAEYAATEAFRRVRRYRDELRQWLQGGEQPPTWGMR